MTSKTARIKICILKWTSYWNCLCTSSSSSLWRSSPLRACLALTLALECSCTPGRAKGCEVSPSLLT